MLTRKRKNHKFMRKNLIIAALSLLFALGASAQKHSYQLNVGVFDKLNVCDNVNVEYRCLPDSAGYIAFEGEQEFADAFIFSNSKGKLKVQVNTEDVDNPNLPVLRVYSQYLNEVENGSEFTTTIVGTLSVPALSIKQIGNGKIIVKDVKANEVSATIATGHGTIALAGQCGIANFKMVGTGDIDAKSLKTETVKCKILGTGEIYCRPDKLLDVRGLGTTKVYYSGTPEVKKVGGGKILPLK